MQDHGTLIISLDFELYWGVHDVMSIDEYKENLLGVRMVVPQLLKLFRHYGIHATWATVGFLFFEDRAELERNLPVLEPRYHDKQLSAYEKMSLIGENEEQDPFHYAASLLQLIGATAFQEIATHTFSHYYCLEPGQTAEEFEADLYAALQTGISNGISIKSIVFPRNQVNERYLEICKHHGIISYRGNENSTIYSPSSFRENQSIYKRILRLIDSYINITGHHIYSTNSLQIFPLVNIPSSRFLRPYHPKTKFLESLRLRRIKSSLTKAAKENKIYHLWWHPHNFGKNMEANVAFLTEILEHFLFLKKQYGMVSLSMNEAGEKLKNRIEP